MQKNILRNINFLIYLALVVAAATLQSTIFKYFPLNYVQPDFLLVLAVYLGFKRDNIEGGVLVVVGAMILEAHSATGRFFLLACYTYVFVITKVVSKVLVVPNRATVVLITISLTVFWKVLMLILLGTVGRAGNALAHFLIYLIPGIITQGFTAAFLLHWFNMVDLKTYKDSHAEDEYDINREF